MTVSSFINSQITVHGISYSGGAIAGLHYNICAEEMENVPLCATDDGHHRKNHPDG